ncbi:MAG: hypothetical protein J6V45_02395 [Kiritimatiellae bacterium]|nr:hypothetical protein [Kiritimatiellia bacterium]
MNESEVNKMSGKKSLTKPNNLTENAAELANEAELLDPLGVMPDVSHLLPQSSIDLTGDAKKAEDGALPLKNAKREQFCEILTGWGGDGLRKRNFEAYEIVYGKKGATARTQSSWLLSIPEVKARVEYLERKVAEARRHDYKVAQQEIDELRLGLIQRGKKNPKLAQLALAAARDFEAAHGLNEEPTRTETTEIKGIVGGDGLSGVRAILAKVTKRTE